MFDREAYHRFIATKGVKAASVGFAPTSLPDRLFAHQRGAVEFALGKGKAALFLDTGLGKSGCEAVFADQAARETGRPSLILTPLAVARQMQRECEAFGVAAEITREAGDTDCMVQIANYERLGKLDVSKYGAVVLDESSILKSFTGSTKRALVGAFRDTPYRLAATATPAPNDHMELGNHAEFLGVMGGMEMLCRWFINDTTTASQDWRLKGHAKDDFWAWVSSWARAASLPSDLGGDDAGFVYHARATIWKDPVVEMQRTKALGLLYKQLKKDSAMSRVGMPDYMLFFRKDEPNPEPITHAPEDLPVTQWQELASPVWMTVQQGNVLNGRMAKGSEDERHICPLQLDVIDRCLTLYSNPGDIVLDPFNGIGSTGFQALKMGRRYVGIELKPEYAAQAARFLTEAEASQDSLIGGAA